jgi:hypothetical protein
MPGRLASKIAAIALSVGFALLTTGCATAPETADEPEPAYVPPEAVTPGATVTEVPEAAPEAAPPTEPTAPVGPAAPEPPVVEPPPDARPSETFDAVVVKAKPRARHEVIRDLVAEANALLRNVPLKYVLTGKGRRETLRGRPVAFALWSEAQKQWTVAHLEIPRPPIRTKPGRPLSFRVLTPGITARHVKGTGAERLMFAFSKGDDPLKVYGRKFPVFDNDLLRKKRWRSVVATAKPIIYLPYTEDTLDPLFVQGGREFLMSTARKALDELRAADARSVAFPGEQLADVVPPELITALAVIEQTDDADYTRKRAGAFDEVLSQYGLKREEAFRYSVSSAGAIGAMQFTNRRGKGTYSMVVRLCRSARLDPVFERGATDLLNAMKAAICLFDIELAQMKPEIRRAYWDNKRVLGIFPVAAYNGGPRNVAKLHRVIRQMRLDLADLRPPGKLSPDSDVTCPCLWTDGTDGVRPVSIPRYNNENRWYVQKYQTALGLFEPQVVAGP